MKLTPRTIHVLAFMPMAFIALASCFGAVVHWSDRALLSLTGAFVAASFVHLAVAAPFNPWMVRNKLDDDKAPRDAWIWSLRLVIYTTMPVLGLVMSFLKAFHLPFWLVVLFTVVFSLVTAVLCVNTLCSAWIWSLHRTWEAYGRAGLLINDDTE